MFTKLVTAEEMRKMDHIAIHERGIPGLELMENAGTAVADILYMEFKPQSVGIVAGKGNNAGDGLVAARLLAEKGVGVRLLLLTEAKNQSEACRHNYQKLPESVQVLEHRKIKEMPEFFADCDIMVDAILGTGVEGPVKGSFGEAIAQMNAMEKRRVAIDIPSGLMANNGQAAGACVIADLTITMGLPKLGMLIGDGAYYCGEILIADIGFPEDLLNDNRWKGHVLDVEEALQLLPERNPKGHKGSFGKLLVLAGSQGMGGAAALTCQAALRSGCGLVYAALPEKVLHEVQATEAVKIPLQENHGHFIGHESWDTLEPYLEEVDAIALGPGLGTRHETIRLVDELVCLNIPMVIDADALNCLQERVLFLTKREAPTLITPHPGEMARIMECDVAEIEEDRLGKSLQAATEGKLYCLLKGFRTIIAEPGGNYYVNQTGNSGMAKGGMGDVLTGLLGGFLAQGMHPESAILSGACLHGLAGDLCRDAKGERGMTAGDVVQFLPEVLKMGE